MSIFDVIKYPISNIITVREYLNLPKPVRVSFWNEHKSPKVAKNSRVYDPTVLFEFDEEDTEILRGLLGVYET